MIDTGKKFSFLTLPCPKCGGTNAEAKWCPGQYKPPLRFQVPSPCILHEGERIHRRCQGCGYSWLELPLDSADPKP